MTTTKYVRIIKSSLERKLKIKKKTLNANKIKYCNINFNRVS